MQGLSGMRGAAQLARAALLVASRGRTLTLPERPAGVETIEVCPLSGKRPGPHCPHTKRDVALSEAELDRVVGSVYAYVEQCFGGLIRLGYASRFG